MPLEDLDRKNSVVLVRNILRLSMSVIAYERKFFPENCFSKKRAPNGSHFHQLTGNSEESDRMIDWLEEGVFAALDKQYLKTVSLLVFQADSADVVEKDEPIERYDFHVDYSASNESLSARTNMQDTTKASAIQATEKVLERLTKTTQALPELPENFVINMVLDYITGTPSEYNPSFFKKGIEVPQNYTQAMNHALTRDFGGIFTKFCDISIGMKTI